MGLKNAQQQQKAHLGICMCSRVVVAQIALVCDLITITYLNYRKNFFFKVV